jgi:archaellin
MTVKQTDRVQIQKFGTDGVELFNQIEAALKALVDETATVNYKGQNALDFKTKCTENAVEFSSYCTKGMQQMSDSITEATTYIASALGGAPIDLEPPVVTVEMPSIEADTSVETAEDGPLVSLRDGVKSSCDQIEALFTQNQSNLQALGSDGWVGPEYDTALSEVTTLTNSMVEAVTNTRTVMTQDITNQLQALGMGG